MTALPFILLGALVSGVLVLLSTRTIRYRVSGRWLVIRWMGLPLRWVRLAELRFCGHKPPLWSERWVTFLANRGRVLVYRRTRGLIRTLVVTPRHPFELREEVDRARRALSGEPAASSPA